ncbi:lipoyl(octanoyl) transferase LipB [Candidatus Binatia bacterium]|nr:lipoyl(octanoyl) transferase LipB [Candidatus Binatia bacterium]
MSSAALTTGAAGDVLPGAALAGEGIPSRWLGRLAFAPALALQEDLRRRHASVGDVVLLLEHEPVYTTGRGGRPENLGRVAADPAIPFERIGRGGDVTYHGPGQLVGYALVDLRMRDRDVHRFLRQMETGVIWTLQALGVRATRWPGRTGVWVVDRGTGVESVAAEPTDVAHLDDHDMQLGRIRKIASLGVGVRGGVTMHGFALNVALDLAPFAAIVPCGLAGVHMTTVEREAARPVRSVRDVAMLAARHVGRALAWPYPHKAAFGEVSS